MRFRNVNVVSVGVAAVALVSAVTQLHAQHTVRRPIDGRPNAVVDLRTSDGVRLVRGQWRYSDTTIAGVDFNAPGPDMKPSGQPIRTYDYTPKAGAADFDDSAWEKIEPAALENRRSTGKLCFNWYRTSVTVPEKVGRFETAGSTVVLEVVVDDYAEVWVDGKLTDRRLKPRDRDGIQLL